MKFLMRVGCLGLLLAGFFFSGMLYQQMMDNRQIKEPVKQEEKLMETVNEGQQKTTCDTVYYVDTYDMKSRKKEESVEEIPLRFMGLTREELEEEIQRYAASPSLTDLEEGFVSMELSSFHPTQIKVRKNYQKEEKAPIYTMRLEDNRIVVYRGEEDEVFMTTELEFEHLPDDVKSQIIQIKYFDDLNTVYDFLESYSS